LAYDGFVVIRPATKRFGLTIVWSTIAVVAAQSPNRDDWQTRAGGKRTFDVASVKQSDADSFTPPNFPLDAGDAFVAIRTQQQPNGRFEADFQVATYITFAYKLSLTQAQIRSMMSTVPKWFATERFRIQARAEGNPTKDQMRLMMQALLADRFKLAVHFESREASVLALTLAKAGVTGPRLRPHAEGPPCDTPVSPEVFPPVCGIYGMLPPGTRHTEGKNSPGRMTLEASRDTTMDRFAASLPSFGGMDRPAINRTGLPGSFDFTLEWVPDQDSASPTPAVNPDDSVAPTFVTALREQLGLKLESGKASMPTLVIDHIERPSEN